MNTANIRSNATENPIFRTNFKADGAAMHGSKDEIL